MTIFGGEVRLDGERVGKLESVTPDTRGDWRQVPPGELARRRRPLPVSLTADGAFAGAFFWTKERGVRERVLNRLAAKEDPADPAEDTPRIPVDVRLVVRLDIEPGDDPEVGIPVVRPRFSRGGPLSTTPQYDLELRRSRVSALIAQFPSATAPTVMTLRLWSRDSAGPVRVVTRPLVGGSPVRFPFGRLRSGTYSWALHNGGQTAAGEFTTPCDARPPAGSGGVVPEEDCSALPFGP